MDLYVSGPREGKVPTSLQASIMLAAKSFAQQLGINRLKTTIQIRVHQDIVVEKGTATEGLCECLDPRTFIVDIALYGNWLGVLAHEFVHIKQFARRELDPQLSRWKNKNYADTDYWNQPWEKEARRLQYKMVERYEKGE